MTELILSNFIWDRETPNVSNGEKCWFQLLQTSIWFYGRRFHSMPAIIPHLSISPKHEICPKNSKFVTLLTKLLNMSESNCQLIAKSKIFCQQQVQVGFPVDKQPIPLLRPSCLPSEPKLLPLHLLFILSSC